MNSHNTTLTDALFVQHRARRIHIEECFSSLDSFNCFIPIMTGSFNYNTFKEKTELATRHLFF